MSVQNHPELGENSRHVKIHFRSVLRLSDLRCAHIKLSPSMCLSSLILFPVHSCHSRAYHTVFKDVTCVYRLEYIQHLLLIQFLLCSC